MRVDTSKVLNKLVIAQSKAEIAIMLYANEGAKQLETYAKTHRRWTDRTARARQTLTGWAQKRGDKVRIQIGHGVYYGVYLELCNEGKYAILNETINVVSPKILKGYEKLLRYIT